MLRSERKVKSVRKPLRELSTNKSNDNGGGGGGRFTKSALNLKKISEKANENTNTKQEKKHEEDDEAELHSDDSLDRLLLVQSDLSSLVRQIDELVVQAFKLKTTSNQERKEIKCFTHDLSEMLSSLKPWVSRFQKMLSGPQESENQLGQSLASKTASATNEEEICQVESPEKTKLDSLISPSPLVSWRANCTVEGGRQLFLLTPLPKSQPLSCKHRGSTKTAFNSMASSTTVEFPLFLNTDEETNDDLLEGMTINPTPCKPSGSVAIETGSTLEFGLVSSPKFPGRDHSMLLMTPCLKMSPPKSCALLESILESSRRGNDKIRKSTPFPTGIQNYCDSSESSGSETSDDLALKYPELLGIQKTYKSGVQKKELDASPNWLFSPPKSCVLLEPPPDSKSMANIPNYQPLPITSCFPNQQTKLSKLKDDDDQVSCHQTKKSCNQEPVGGNFELVANTPMWKEPESTFRTGRRPGESTLKKELWTRFEAASTHGLHLNVSGIQKTAKKGFLEMLDEASCDEESTIPDRSR